MLLFIPFLLINHSRKKYKDFPGKGQECFPAPRMEPGGEKTHLGIKGYGETEQNCMQEPLAETVLSKCSKFNIITSETGR